MLHLDHVFNRIDPPLPPSLSRDPYSLSLPSSLPLYFSLLLLTALSQICDALGTCVCGHPLKHGQLTSSHITKESDSLLQQSSTTSSSYKGGGLKGHSWISARILTVTFS